MLEAMACGCPVAAFAEAAPLQVIAQGSGGVVSHDLAQACRGALRLDRRLVRQSAVRRSWSAIARDLLGALVPIRGRARAAVPR